MFKTITKFITEFICMFTSISEFVREYVSISEIYIRVGLKVLPKDSSSESYTILEKPRTSFSN